MLVAVAPCLRISGEVSSKVLAFDGMIVFMSVCVGGHLGLAGRELAQGGSLRHGRKTTQRSELNVSCLWEPFRKVCLQLFLIIEPQTWCSTTDSKHKSGVLCDMSWGDMDKCLFSPGRVPRKSSVNAKLKDEKKKNLSLEVF